MYCALWDRRHSRATRISQCTLRYTPCALTDTSWLFVPPISHYIMFKSKLVLEGFVVTMHEGATLHRLISVDISQWMTFDPAELPILPGGKCCALALLNIITKFPKEKYQFLSDLSLKSSIPMCSICMITKEYKMFFRKLYQSKNDVSDELPPKRWTVAETFAWRFRGRVRNPRVLPREFCRTLRTSPSALWQQTRQIGLNHDYNMTFSISPHEC